MASEFPNMYARLVAEHGIEGAKEIMKQRRAKVNPKNIKGRPVTKKVATDEPKI